MEYADYLIGRYRSAGVLVDTNLLLLYFIGAYNRAQVARFKRTADRGFVAEDFDTLADVLGQFETVVTTPYILTEVSNLMGQLSGHVKDGCFNLFAHSIPTLHERFAPSADLAADAAFVTFGITDASILKAAAEPYLVLTDDLPLYGYLAGKSVDVLNFNNLRPLGYQ